MGIGRWNDAKTHLETPAGQFAAAMPGSGNCWARARPPWRIRPGRRFAAKVDSHVDPDEVDAYEHLAEVLRRVERPAEADAWMNKLVQANPRDARANVLDGEYLRGNRAGGGSNRAGRKSAGITSNGYRCMLLAARSLRGKAPVQQSSQNFAQRAIESAPDQRRRLHHPCPGSASYAGDRKKAIACLETGAEMRRIARCGAAVGTRTFANRLGRLRGDRGRLSIRCEASRRRPH